MSKEKLIALNTNNKKSNWVQKATFRKENQKWLNYSSQIARRILAKIDGDKELSQVILAKSLNVSRQQINKIVKGQENLTLETISKISDALGIELISFPDYKYKYSNPTQIFTTLNYITRGSFINSTIAFLDPPILDLDSIWRYKTKNYKNDISSWPSKIEVKRNNSIESYKKLTA